MSMKVVHLSLTPLAGSPIRIVNALNRRSDCAARLIDFNPNVYGSRTFPEDLDWRTDRDEALSLLTEADLVVAHHFFDFRDNPFGVDFTRAVRPSCRFARQFHSQLDFICRCMNLPRNVILDDPYPKLVIPHYAERTFLDARIVPNIVPIDDEAYLPQNKENSRPVIFYSATFKESAWTWRGDTKGYPEVTRLLKRLRGKADLDIVYGVPFLECLRRKRCSDIVVEDIVTGSYHLTALEALSQGIPTLSYLDNRTQTTLRQLTGALTLPFVNVHYQEAEPVLRRLIEDSELRRQIGMLSRQWMEKYYTESLMIEHHVRAYRDILDGKDFREYRSLAAAQRWLEIDLYDDIWAGRRQRAISFVHRLALDFYTGPYEYLKRMVRKYLSCLKIFMKSR